jgi:hypothetical protein
MFSVEGLEKVVAGKVRETDNTTLRILHEPESKSIKEKVRVKITTRFSERHVVHRNSNSQSSSILRDSIVY